MPSTLDPSLGRTALIGLFATGQHVVRRRCLEQIRVLHCVPWLTSGGVERRRLELARGLSPRYEQRIACLRAKPELANQFRQAGVVVDDFDQQFSPSALVRVAQLARSFRPDIVHGAVFEGVSMAAAAALASLAPHLVLEEIAYPSQRSWRGNMLFRLLSLRASRCVGVSPAVLEYMRSVAKVPENKLRLITNGISPPQLPRHIDRAEQRAAWGIPAGAFVIGSIGRVYDWLKRFSDIIRAVDQLSDDIPELYAIIVGDGQDLLSLRELAQQLGVGERIKFTGYQHDVGPMLFIMDAFVLASARESFGLVLVEAMFSRVPVIGTNVGGIPDIVTDGQTGLLVPVGRPELIAAAVTKLVRDPELRQRLAEAGYARAVQQFGAERYVSDVEALYDEITGRNAPAA